MNMPPAGVVSGMDEEAVIQAEIDWELEHINLEDDGQEDIEDVAAELEEEQIKEESIPEELGYYIKRLQEQTSNFQKELEECDELITHTDRQQNNGMSDALIPYEDFNLLSQLAKESGCDIEQYKQKILSELEQDDDILYDDLAEVLTDKTDNLSKPSGSQGHEKADKEHAEGDTGTITECKTLEDPSLPVAIERAMEHGVVPAEAPVSPVSVPLNNPAGIQQMLREQLVRLENTYRERTLRIKQEEALKREKEESRQKQEEEERQHRKQEIERQEQKLNEQRQAAEKKIKQEEEDAQRQMTEQMKQFKAEIRKFEAETEREKAALAKARMEEEIRLIDKKHNSALLIQRHYRGYRTRKQYRPVLEEKREERRRLREEQRIGEIEKEIEERERLAREEEEQKRLKLEEEQKRKEEEKRQREEEKRRKKEEEERKKADKKKKKEEEKQRLEEEKQKKKEEERRRKEEEAERKSEEKRLKEEEKRKKEEEKRREEKEAERGREEKRHQEEEEKRRKEEKEKQLKEQERMRKKLEQEEESRKKYEMRKQQETKEKDLEKREVVNQNVHLSTEVANMEKSNGDIRKVTIQKVTEYKDGTDLQLQAKEEFGEKNSSSDKVTNERCDSDIVKEIKLNEVKKEIVKGKTEKNSESKSGQLKEITENVNRIENNIATRTELSVSLEKISGMKSPRIPHPPSSPRKKQTHPSKDVLTSVKKPDTQSSPVWPADCLPKPLEARRLTFIKECLPWSKISNEPWKLKGVTSRKPLRRPSSAKKLSPLPEDIILKAARVASLKQVTTVQLSDLPGYSMSALGQCWGLKYLSMVRCNLRVLEGLQQCKQLLYIGVQDNKLEYIDLKDIGSLEVLDMSHNCLSAIHGLDNCTNLRWIDISHNNITRLGGLETLRRLHTLKLSYNQLISTTSLGNTPTIQILDLSANHLQSMEDLEKLCLLLSLDVSANNILKIPDLKNQVLLHELLLTDNSITSLEELSQSWLPLLHKVVLSQNSISEPESLQNCLTMRYLDLNNNQILDAEVLLKCIENSLYLEQLNLEENPFIEEVDNSFFSQLHKILPRLEKPASTSELVATVKPRCNFEVMCLSQAQIYTDMFSELEQIIRIDTKSSNSLAQKCDSLFKFCDKTFQVAVEHRYAHEYGEVPATLPAAPITPRSGRPNSARKLVPKGELFMNPKDLLNNDLQISSETADLNKQGSVTMNSTKKKVNSIVSTYSSPKDLFEQALKSSGSNFNSSKNVLVNGTAPLNKDSVSNDHERAAAVRIQAAWRGWSVRQEISQQTKIWLATITIQSAWRGCRVRKWYKGVLEERRKIQNIDPELVEKLHKAATTIQAAWRGYWLRSKLLAALEYARFDDDDHDYEDALDLNGEDFDVDKFMDFNEDLLDNEWRPPSTPDIPPNHPVLRKPPSGRPKIPPISTEDMPPSDPRQAWKNIESPISYIPTPLGKIHRPTSSVGSGADSHRSGWSKKEEKLSEEWGFKDSSTAHLMLQRAKKMKYNAERKKKISRLDPKQRLRLFQKLQEVAHIDQHVQLPQRKTLPRKEYFQARQDEMVRKEREKQEEYHTRASRIYEWLHLPVNNYAVTDSIINQGLNQCHRFASESNLPDVRAGKRVQLTSGLGSLELQSVDSMSNAGDQRRRFSVGSGSSVVNKLPPISPAVQSNSAPAVKAKERMSWRNPKVNQSVGWGGGKKRGNVH